MKSTDTVNELKRCWCVCVRERETRLSVSVQRVLVYFCVKKQKGFSVDKVILLTYSGLHKAVNISSNNTTTLTKCRVITFCTCFLNYKDFPTKHMTALPPQQTLKAAMGNPTITNCILLLTSVYWFYFLIAIVCNSNSVIVGHSFSDVQIFTVLFDVRMSQRTMVCELLTDGLN